MGIDWFVGFRLIISSLRFLTVTEQQEVVCVFVNLSQTWLNHCDFRAVCTATHDEKSMFMIIYTSIYLT